MSRYVHTLKDLIGPQKHQTEIRIERQGTVYMEKVRAVPEPNSGNRWRAAWAVLTGRAYAISWPKAGELEKALSN
jgi:hypothetical protein